MSDLFNIYEDNLNITIDKIKKITETFLNLSKGKIKNITLLLEKAEYAIQDANNCFKESEKLLKQMEMECQANSNKISSNFKIKLRNYKNEFEIVKKHFLKIQENYITQKSREALILGSEDISQGDTGGHQKHKLIENEEITWNQINKLDHAKVLAKEAENVSHEVMRSLENQSSQLKEIKVKVSDMNNNLEESTHLLSSMMKRENRNKIIIGGFVLILILIFLIFTLYYLV